MHVNKIGLTSNQNQSNPIDIKTSKIVWIWINQQKIELNEFVVADVLWLRICRTDTQMFIVNCMLIDRKKNRNFIKYFIHLGKIMIFFVLSVYIYICRVCRAECELPFKWNLIHIKWRWFLMSSFQYARIRAHQCRHKNNKNCHKHKYNMRHECTCSIARRFR